MFSFLNTLEILPVDQVAYIVKHLREADIDASVMLKGKTGMPGFVSLNAWVAHAEPICHTLPTELVCCAGQQAELRVALDHFVMTIHAAGNHAVEREEALLAH